MNYSVLTDASPLIKLKTTINSAVGAMGVGAAATAHTITFHESSLFKATIAVLGLVLACFAIYNIYLDVKIKRKKLEEDK